MKKDRALVIMLNPNGWRNPTVFGGGEIQTINTMNRIDDIEWILILPEHLRGVVSKLNNNNIKCFFISPFFKKTNVFWDIFQGIIFTLRTVWIGFRERNQYAVMYASTTNFSDIFPSYLISIFFGKKLVTKYHISLYRSSRWRDIYHSYRLEKNTFFDSIIRSTLARITLLFMHHATLIFVVSAFLKEQLIQCGFSNEKIVINYNGIDFQKLESFREVNVFKKYDLCFMGRIEESKGILEFVKLIEGLKNVKPNISAVIVGDGSFLNETRKVIKNEGLDGNIAVTGFLGEKRYSYLQQSRLFLSPTFANEGFGLSIIEALYFGIPVIAYTQPVFEEIFNRYQMIKLINPDQDSLKSAVDNFLSKGNTFQKEDLSMFDLSACAQREFDALSRIF